MKEIAGDNTMKKLFGISFRSFLTGLVSCIFLNAVNAQWVDKNESENYTARHECSVVQAGDKFYVMGGRENSRTLDVYDYATNTWSQLENSAPEEFNHFQATEYKGLIWVIGAFKNNAFPNEEPADYVWAFNPVSEEWIRGPLIPQNRRRGSTGLVVYNDKFYITGGNTVGHNGGYVSWFDEYDPQTGEWTVLADAPRARDHFHSAIVGDKLYLAGGRLSGGAEGTFKPVIPEVDVYDFNNGQWSTLAAAQNLPTPRGAPSVAVLNGKLLVIGGEVENEMVYGVEVNDALKITEQYDPATQTWQRLADMNYERHGTQAIVSGNGVYVLAGSPQKGGGNQKNMEYYGVDAPAGTPSTASSLTLPDAVELEVNSSKNFDMAAVGGNVGVFIRSMEITGSGASNFQITSGALENVLLPPGSTNPVTITLNGSGIGATAVLTINYGASSSSEIILNNGELAAGVVNPGTQYDQEGDNVSLQILTNGTGNNLEYSATGLPPSLTINPSTGLITGTVRQPGNSSGNAFLEESGRVIIEAESGTIVPNWSLTNTGGATGIIAGTNSFNSQNGGTIPYDITISTPGVYRFSWRNFYSGSSESDQNDNWLRFPNNSDVWFFGYKGNPGSESSLISNVQGAQTDIVFPKGSSRITASTTPEGGGSNGYFKIWRSGGSPENYDWQARTSDNDAHNIYVWFVNAGTYTMEISERSSGHAIDKVALYKVDGPSYSDSELTSAPQSPRETDNTPGAAENSPYEVEVTVIDNDNNETSSETFTWIIDNSGNPVAEASAAPLSGNLPLQVEFRGIDSADDEGIASYLWQFGDGASSESTLANPTFVYSEEGVYTATLTVTDSNGNSDSETVQITVAPAPTYTISASAGENGSISPAGEIVVTEGDDPEFNFNADTGYEIADVLVDGSSVGAISSYLFENVSASHTIEVSFSAVEAVSYTITASSGLGGAISPVGATEVDSGADQLFEMTPEEGYQIADVLIDGNSVGAVESYLFENVTTAHTIEVSFERITYIITASSGLGGEISPAGSIELQEGAAQVFEMTPEEGFEIADVLVDNVSLGVIENYTFTNVTESHSIHIIFTQIGNEPPVAVASSSLNEGPAPLSVNFDGSASSDDVGIVEYTWDFGDGSAIETGVTTTHVYTAVGVYSAILSVEDSEGITTTDILQITVVEPDGPVDPEDDFVLFPNPASELVELVFAEPIDVRVISIFDLQGKLLESINQEQLQPGNVYTIDVASLSAGVYVVAAYDVNGKSYERKMLVR
ncbi:PKD domain-containing protein [Pareuzebyella sediminis]|uniref:PKD domain-containing protein n=1 Tax=Pareuzebyella sediminis TaxID=2607998 RepID=UPI001E2F0E4D|nr:PKD domain-containing protein [Pareuzebyella sediminis]